MKPLLPPAPATLEDVCIWSDVCSRGWWRHGVKFATALVNRGADARDAELMHRAACLREGLRLDHSRRGFPWSGLLVLEGDLYYGGSRYTRQPVAHKG